MLSNANTGGARRISRTVFAALMGASALVASSTAFAQTAPVSQNATVNLINRLVDKKILTRAEADEMIAQAEAEAGQARATAQAAQTAQQTAQTAVAATAPASAQPGTSVRYVPQFVRDQIKEEVKAEVLADAKTQGLVAPDAMPEWVRRIRITGDLRLRDEGRFFDKGNGLDFANVGAINNGSAYDPNNVDGIEPPILNSTRNRNYMRIRARLGIEADIDPGLAAYFRVATGDQNSPVSTNANLGGYFNNKSIWLDRAYLDFRPVAGAHIFAGRMANPFRLSELVWDEDINLDGVALSYERSVGGGLSAFAMGGAFPLDYGAENGPDNATSDLKTGRSKWLFAGQVGASWKASETVTASLDAAYYHYRNVEGGLSPACYNNAAFCLTDWTRPGFSQKGNTLFALRDLITVDSTDNAAPQYYGLASQFQILAVSGALDWLVSDGLKLNVTGHYAKNLGYSRADVLSRGFNAKSGLSQIVNNNETCSVAVPVGSTCANAGGTGVFKSGDTAWLARATFGTPQIAKWGDWQLSGSYRHIDPDALLDAFTDSDFRLGGTNAKGWTIEGTYGLMSHTSIGLRWLSGTEVSGTPFRVDVMQADLNVKF